MENSSQPKQVASPFAKVSKTNVTVNKTVNSRDHQEREDQVDMQEWKEKRYMSSLFELKL